MQNPKQGEFANGPNGNMPLIQIMIRFLDHSLKGKGGKRKNPVNEKHMNLKWFYF